MRIFSFIIFLFIVISKPIVGQNIVIPFDRQIYAFGKTNTPYDSIDFNIIKSAQLVLSDIKVKDNYKLLTVQNEKKEIKPLVYYLLKMVQENGVYVFSPYTNDNFFSFEFTLKEFTERLGQTEELYSIENENGEILSQKRLNPINYTEIDKYLLLHLDFYNFENQKIQSRIVGICPVRKWYVEDDIDREDARYRACGWFYYPEIRKYCKKLNIYNEYYLDFNYSLDDFFVYNEFVTDSVITVSPLPSSLFRTKKLISSFTPVNTKKTANCYFTYKYLDLKNMDNWNLYYPIRSSNNLTNLTSLLLTGLDKKQIKVYRNESLNDTISVAEFRQQLGEQKSQKLVEDVETGVAFNSEYLEPINPEQIAGYIIKELNFTDKNDSIIHSRVIAMQPVRIYYKEWDVDEQEPVYRKTSWFDYSECRKILSSNTVITFNLDDEDKTFDEIFFNKQYKSSILNQIPLDLLVAKQFVNDSNVFKISDKDLKNLSHQNGLLDLVAFYQRKINPDNKQKTDEICFKNIDVILNYIAENMNLNQENNDEFLFLLAYTIEHSSDLPTKIKYGKYAETISNTIGNSTDSSKNYIYSKSTLANISVNLLKARQNQLAINITANYSKNKIYQFNQAAYGICLLYNDKYNECFGLSQSIDIAEKDNFDLEFLTILKNLEADNIKHKDANLIRKNGLLLKNRTALMDSVFISEFENIDSVPVLQKALSIISNAKPQNYEIKEDSLKLFYYPLRIYLAEKIAKTDSSLNLKTQRTAMYNEYADLLWRKQKYDLALIYYKQSIKNDSLQTEPYRHIPLLELIVNGFDAARPWYEKYALKPYNFKQYSYYNKIYQTYRPVYKSDLLEYQRLIKPADIEKTKKILMMTPLEFGNTISEENALKETDEELLNEHIQQAITNYKQTGKLQSLLLSIKLTNKLLDTYPLYRNFMSNTWIYSAWLRHRVNNKLGKDTDKEIVDLVNKHPCIYPYLLKECRYDTTENTLKFSDVLKVSIANLKNNSILYQFSYYVVNNQDYPIQSDTLSGIARKEMLKNEKWLMEKEQDPQKVLSFVILCLQLSTDTEENSDFYNSMAQKALTRIWELNPDLNIKILLPELYRQAGLNLDINKISQGTFDEYLFIGNEYFKMAMYSDYADYSCRFLKHSILFYEKAYSQNTLPELKQKLTEVYLYFSFFSAEQDIAESRAAFNKAKQFDNNHKMLALIEPFILIFENKNAEAEKIIESSKMMFYNQNLKYLDVYADLSDRLQNYEKHEIIMKMLIPEK